MGKSSWVNKQWFRFRQAWLFYQPFLNVLTTFAWLVTMLAITAWFTITFEVAIILFIIGIFGIWLTGYGGDKTGFWQEWGSRNIKITNTEVQFHLFQAQGDIIALGVLQGLKQIAPEIDTTFLEESIKREKEWFEMRAKDDDEEPEEEVLT